MNKSEIKAQLQILEELKKEVQRKINRLEKQLEDDQSIQNNEFIIDTNTKSGYFNYLINIKQLQEHTIANYFGHLRGIRIRLEKYADVKLPAEIYSISDKDQLLEIKQLMSKCKKLIEDNKKQHNAFTAAFNNYVRYVFEYYKKDETTISEFVIDE